MKTNFLGRLAFSFRLARTGIRKNRRLYLPYLCSQAGMVMMFFIISALSFSPLLSGIAGGSQLRFILSIGQYVIAFFALIFLFYTNSFLVRRRYREFGLYSVLGMDKRGIGLVMLCESVITSAAGLLGGLLLGIAFSKFAELVLLRMVREEVGFSFTVPLGAVLLTAALFGAVFLLLLVKSLIAVGKSGPLELIRSENAGEKPPKANVFLAIAGAALLGGAYYIAVTIKSPLKALMLFFVAVLMVIAGTYLLFISGSVALCGALKKNKKFYYKKEHFVSVSSMTYRMKRNGAGLASICILCTMVLVMISSSASLYFGENDLLSSRFEYENEFTVYFSSSDNFGDPVIEDFRTGYADILSRNGVQTKRVGEYRYSSVYGLLKDGALLTYREAGATAADYDLLRGVFFLCRDDYERMTGESLSGLSDGEILLYTGGRSYTYPSLTIGGTEFSIVGKLDGFPRISVAANTTATDPMFAVISDFSVLKPLEALNDLENDDMEVDFGYYFGFDPQTALSEEETNALLGQFIDFSQEMKPSFPVPQDTVPFMLNSLQQQKADFFVNFGGLFFIGIILSVVFIFAAAMIIYYKQISEGYEDRARFAIMRKVGMTDGDIRGSINSQVLTVFYAPLLLAALHLVFAFPMVWKLLRLFWLENLAFAVTVTAISFAVFAAIYALIYRITAKTYYSIVSSEN